MGSQIDKILSSRKRCIDIKCVVTFCQGVRYLYALMNMVQLSSMETLILFVKHSLRLIFFMDCVHMGRVAI